MANGELYILKARDRLVENFVLRILIFLGAAVFAIISLAGLGSTAVVWAIGSFQSVFHAMTFWYLVQRCSVDEEYYYQELSHYENTGQGKEADQASLRYDEMHRLRKRVEIILIIFVIASYIFLLSALLDQYTEIAFFPARLSDFGGGLIISYSVLGIGLWSMFYWFVDRDQNESPNK